jgi:hypothetical protein
VLQLDSNGKVASLCCQQLCFIAHVHKCQGAENQQFEAVVKYSLRNRLLLLDASSHECWWYCCVFTYTVLTSQINRGHSCGCCWGFVQGAGDEPVWRQLQRLLINPNARAHGAAQKAAAPLAQ